MADVFLILLALILMTACVQATTAPQMFGVNLAGGEFGTTYPGTYGMDYTYPNQAEFSYYHSKGLNLIRLPFRWERVQHTLNGALDSTEMGRIDTVLGYARTYGMKVILDMHNYDAYYISGTSYSVGSSTVPYSALQNVWSQIASRYATNTTVYGYDIMNEPQDTLSSWNTGVQAVVNSIRVYDTSHYVVIEGVDFSGAVSWTSDNNTLNVTDSANLVIYSAHIYLDANDSGVYAQTYAAQGAYPTIGTDRMQPFLQWIKQKGVNGYVGEFGVPNADATNSAQWNVALSDLLQTLKNAGVSATCWAGGPAWGNNILSIEPTNNFTVDAPPMAVLQDYGQGTGLLGQYYNDGSNATYPLANPYTSSPVLTETDPTLNFNWAGASPGAGVTGSNFSAKWTGKVLAPVAGSYTFNLTGDDGVRLYIDGVKVIDAWYNQSASYNYTTTFAAGSFHQIEVDYYQDSGGSQCILAWSYPGQTQQVIPQTQLYPPSQIAAGTGLLGRYYNDGSSATYPLTNPFTSTPVLTEVDPTLNFNWAGASPGEGVTGVNFSTRWTGQVLAPVSGSYTFNLTGDDGVRLYIDGTRVINAWYNQSASYSCTVTLTAGSYHAVEVDYYQDTGGSQCVLGWSYPGQTQQVIPTSQLFPILTP